jgi:uncharacterized membrane protein
MLQLISLVLLVYSYFMMRTTLPTLPRVIPTHFNAAGVANGWGSPDTLWILFGAQALTCVVFLTIPYLGQLAPGAVHFGSRRLNDFPEAQRPQLVKILNDMAGYMAIIMNVFFVWVLRQILRAVTEPIPHISMFAPLTLLIGGMSITSVVFMLRFRRAATGDGEKGS